MLTEIACRALREGKCLELRYDGFSRWVEVHAVGYSKMGHALMRVWHVRGGGKTGERSGWRLMRLEDVSAAALSGDASEAPRKGYKRGDPAMDRIICEV